MSAPRFVGRQAELATLAEAMAAAPAVVLVAGEAGIGKTRLLTEFLAAWGGEQAGGRALTAVCPPFAQPHTLGPITDAVHQDAPDPVALRLSGLAGALRPLFPEWSAHLPPDPGPAEDASAARHRVFRALAELLDRLRVALLAVEDAHWADEATLEFLLFLATRRPRRINLVITYRPEDVPDGSLLPRLMRQASGGGGQRLDLTPLDVEGTAVLMSSMLDEQEVSEEFAAFLHRHTDGLPLAIEESVRLMAGRADLTRLGGAWLRKELTDIEVPPTVRDAVLERVARLGDDARAVLDAVSVLADPASEQTVRTVAGLAVDRLTNGLAEAIESGLLAEDDRGLVAFRHVLAGRAVYDSITKTRTRLLHRRAGRVLQRLPVPPVTQLGRHFSAAGENGLWARYAEQAADVAVRAGDDTTALVVLHELVTKADLSPQEMARLVKKIPHTSLTGLSRHAELERALRSALRAGGLTAAEEADIRMQLGMELFRMEEFAAARVELEQAVDNCTDKAEAAYAMVLLGYGHGDPTVAEHLAWLRRADLLSAPLAPIDRLRCLVGTFTALLHLGEADGWVQARRLPAATDGAGGHVVARGHLNLGDGAMIWGRYAQARSMLQASLDLAEQRNYLRIEEMVQVTMVHLDWLTGAWAGLQQRASALAAAEDLHPLCRREAATVTGLLLAATGEPDRAAGQLRLALSGSRERGAVHMCLEPAAALTRLLLAAGELEEALRVSAEPVGAVRRKGVWLWATDIAPARVAALTMAGRLAEAADLVGAFRAGLGDRDLPAPAAALRQCHAMLAEARGDVTTAATLYVAASAAWRALPRPYDALLAGERAASCLLAAGRSDAALRMLATVRAGLDDLGARQDAARVARTANAIEPASGDGGTRPRGRPAYGDQLSPRELAVVRLVTDGRSNREIADTLVVSTQTVASHVRSAMRKLRVSSRTSLAVSAERLGITRE